MNYSISHISSINLKRALCWHAGKEWSPSDWFTALAGEAGELADAFSALALTKSVSIMGDTIKKLNRHRDGLAGGATFRSEAELKQDLMREIADVYLYLDLFAQRMDIDLEEAIQIKFNEVSKKYGFPERL